MCIVDHRKVHIWPHACGFDRVGIGHELDFEPNLLIAERKDLNVKLSVRKRFGHRGCWRCASAEIVSRGSRVQTVVQMNTPTKTRTPRARMAARALVPISHIHL